jgi:hypothetical protein
MIRQNGSITMHLPQPADGLIRQRQLQSFSVLADMRGIVPHVVAQIQCVERRLAHATIPRGHAYFHTWNIDRGQNQ